MLTSDLPLKLACESIGVECYYISPIGERPKILDYFSSDTMSVHLMCGAPPMAKRGRPGTFKLVRLSDKPLTEEEIREIASELIALAFISKDATIEINREGAKVIQFREFRIAISEPPFSSNLEITAVRPLLKVTLDDYALSEKLKKRLERRAEGILIAGPPGAGKTTFAGALIEFYRQKGKIVKTMESPRDLQVSPEVIQYGPLDGSMEHTAELLLLVRPDYTCFDEMRKTSDFEIYTDMRLAGVGMIGVVHSTSPISAIQRFIGRVDLGMLPHIVDTVIFIEGGRIKKVYSLSMSVKVPTGFRSEDLARPVIEVKDFETGRVEYEIYSFAEEVVVMPVRKSSAVSLRFKIKERRASIVLDLGKKNANRKILLVINGLPVTTFTTDKNGRVRISKRDPLAQKIIEAETIELKPVI